MRSIWLDLSICQKLSCCCPLMGRFWSFGFLIYTLSCVHIKRGHFIFLILLLLVFVKYWANTSATFMEPWSQKSAGERSGEFGSQSIPSLRLPDIFLYWVEQAPYLELLPTEPNKKTPHDLNNLKKRKKVFSDIYMYSLFHSVGDRYMGQLRSISLHFLFSSPSLSHSWPLASCWSPSHITRSDPVHEER